MTERVNATGLYVSLADRAYEALLSDITEGRLPPGSLLDRRSLAERLGMSTIPVLEAIRRLEKDGLVESRPRWPARVRVHDARFVEGEYAVREALEAQAARLCVERATDGDLREMEEMGRRVDRLLSDRVADPEEGQRLHLRFHVRLAELSRCPALVEQIDMINRRVLMRRRWSRATLSRSLPDDWHARIPAIIAGRDVLKADEAARVHVRRGLADELAALKMMGL